MYLQYPFELNAVSYTRNWKIGASIFNVPQFHRTDSLAGADGFEPPINGIKIRCLTNLATPPVLRQGIEPKAAAYESAALPLSYLNSIRKELTPLWRSDSLRYLREFLLSKRSPGERPDKRNWPPAFSEPGELASLTRKIFFAPRTGPFIGLARSLLCSSPQVLRLGSRGLGTNTLTCRDDLRRDR